MSPPLGGSFVGLPTRVEYLSPWGALLPRGVVCCNHYLVHPRRARTCGVDGSLSLVHPCARLVCSIYGVRGSLALIHRSCCVVGWCVRPTLVYGTTASPLCLELRSPAAW